MSIKSNCIVAPGLQLSSNIIPEYFVFNYVSALTAYFQGCKRGQARQLCQYTYDFSSSILASRGKFLSLIQAYILLLLSAVRDGLSWTARTLGQRNVLPITAAGTCLPTGSFGHNDPTLTRREEKYKLSLSGSNLRSLQVKPSPEFWTCPA